MQPNRSARGTAGSCTAGTIAIICANLALPLSIAKAPTIRRAAKLRNQRSPAQLRASQELPGTAADVLAAVQSMGLEGVVAKRRDSRYEPGERSSAWVKLKLHHQQELVVGGYRPDGSTSIIDALVVGYYDAGELRYASKVRAGFVPHSRRDLRARLNPLDVDICPFADIPSEVTLTNVC